MAISLTLLLLPPSATATELKLATWNLEWLTSSDRDLPADVHPKRPQDIDLLRRYATELDADVIAVQEVDGAAITASVFPPDSYSIHLSHDHVVQRVGIVVRRGLHYDVNPDLTGLDVDPGRQLRSGVDVTLQLQPPLRVLAVHLKTGCPDARLSNTTRRSCTELRAQFLPCLMQRLADREVFQAQFFGDLFRGETVDPCHHRDHMVLFF